MCIRRKPLVLRAGRAVAITAALAAAAPALAEDPPAARKKTELEEASELVISDQAAKAFPEAGEIVVSAEGGGVPVKYAGARDIIDAETVSQYAGTNVADLIRRVPGMYVTQQTNNEAYINVGSRGLSPQRSRYVGFLLDGLPLAMAPYGLNDKDLFAVTMERVGTIDSIRGGAALRYGPHAVGGVVNLISPAIPTEPMLQTKVKIGSDSLHSEMLHAGGTFGDWGISLIHVEKHGDGFREHSEFDIGDFYARARYRIDEDDTLLFTTGRYMIEADFPGSLSTAEYEDDPEQSNRTFDRNRASRTMYAVNYQHEFSPRSAFDLTLFYQDLFNEVRPSAPNPGPVFTRYSPKPTWADVFNLDARFTWEAKIAGMRHTFSHLLYVNRENAENFFERVPIPPGPVTTDQHAKFRGRGVAGFTEDVIDITDDLQASLAFRAEQIEMTSTSLVPGQQGAGRFEDYTLMLPAESLAYTFAPRTAVFVGRQDSFRPPYYDNFDPTSASYYNKGGIEPELARSREIGVRTRGFHGFDAQVTAFRTNFKDLIVVVPIGGVNKFVNVGTATSDGLEASLSYDFGAMSESMKGLSAYVTRTRQKSLITSGDFDGNDQPFAPRKLGSWGASYEHGSGAWIRVDGTSSGSSYAQQDNFDKPNTSGTEGQSPAFRVWDLSVGWKQNDDGKGLSVGIGVTNLFDKEYFLRSGGLNAAPGRAVYGTVSYTLTW